MNLDAHDATDLRDLLASTPLGAASEVSGLLPRFVRRSFSSGNSLVVEGDRSSGLAVIGQGSVRATRRVSDDRDLTVFILKRGDVFGFLPLLDGGPCPLSLTAESDGTVYRLDRQLFRDFLLTNAAFGAQLLAYLAERYRDCLDQLGMLGKPGAVARLAAALLGQLPPDAESGAVIAWPMRQTSLAQALGVAPENLSRAISRLQQMGIVHRASGHRLRIDDPARLRLAAQRSLPGLDDRQ